MNRRLHPLFDDEGAIGAESGVEVTPAAEVNTQVDESQTGAEDKGAAEPEKQNNFEKAFAKRLAAKEAEWEAKTSEKYKDYDLHKEMSEYLSELNGGVDALTLKERRELEQLHERAEKENVPPEVLKRIDQLEAEAAEGKQLKQNQQEEQRVKGYFSTMDKFLEGKGVESKDLNQFMIDNKLSYDPEAMEKSFDIAYKAMKADDAIAKLATAKEDAIKEFLAAKKGTRVEGAPGTASTQAVDTRKMSWGDLDKHALERVKAASTPQ